MTEMWDGSRISGFDMSFIVQPSGSIAVPPNRVPYGDGAGTGLDSSAAFSFDPLTNTLTVDSAVIGELIAAAAQDLVLQAESATSGNTAGNDVNITAGDGFGSGAGGAVLITSGSDGSGGDGAVLNVYGSTSGLPSGGILMTGGASANGTALGASFEARGAGAGGVGGYARITGGNISSSGGVGGGVIFTMGTGGSGGGPGQFFLNNSWADNNAQTVTVGNVGPGSAAVSIKRWIPFAVNDGNGYQYGWLPHFGV
ncbi:MAG: hypothetical protein IPO08_23595 [Xanthomonadales bacterium]|nr:hypothetical protein [Xanthomonadales bacterium]